jgi:hypothetical protein
MVQDQIDVGPWRDGGQAFQKRVRTLVTPRFDASAIAGIPCSITRSPSVSRSVIKRSPSRSVSCRAATSTAPWRFPHGCLITRTARP